MKVIFVIAVFVMALNNAAYAGFEGNVVLTPAECEKAGKCISMEKLKYTDSKGVVWEAKADLSTDGASIPAIVRPIVGQPFDPTFIKAAIVHDHYCDRHVRPWRTTHRVFYEGLLDQGVPKGKAKVMYYAVYLGGPKWLKLAQGNNCGKNCVNLLGQDWVSGKQTFIVRESDYGAVSKVDVDALAAVLKANPNALTLEQLEERAQSKRPGDLFYGNGDELHINDTMIPELRQRKVISQ